MEEIANARRKRINRLKKIILGFVGMAIVIPTVICVVLAIKVSGLNSRINELNELLAKQEQEALSEEVTSVFTTAHIEESPRETGQETHSKQMQDEDESGYDKRVYLTFDDGPSSNTSRILDILKQYGVKATFFVLGKTDEQSKELYRRIVAEGHTLGMHSYSHKYEEIYVSKEAFVEDLTKLQEYLYEVTGVWPRYYRFPGGSSNQVSRVDMQELIAYLEENDIVYYDWNVASGDAVSMQLPKDTIVNNCVSQVKRQADSIILLHDAGEKDTTVEALPEIISQVRMDEDACFLPISDDTPPIQHLKAKGDSVDSYQ